jgi:hypothetical protein
MKTRDFIYSSKTTKIMKTGGIMNFLKKAGVILMVVAVFATSCNKYADDFAQINTKLDALATQVAGVTTLSADITALKASVASIASAVGALPTTASISALSTSLAGLATKIDAITTTLGTVATAGTATKAVVDGLKTDLTALAAKVAADNLAMNTKLTALGTTDAAQTAQLTALVADNVTILAGIAALQTSLDGLALTGSGTDATAVTIKGLQLMLDAQKVQLEQLLANSNMYNAAVQITTDAEVDFYFTKIAIWPQGGMINAGLLINTTNISAGKLADLRTICNNIIAVIGTGSAMDLTTKSGDDLVFGKLTTITGNYTVTGFDVDDSLLGSVGGNVVWNYDGPYASATLSKVTGSLTLVAKAASTTPVLVGTTSISLPAVAVTGSVYDVLAGGTAGVLTYPIATAVDLSGGVTSLTVVKAITVKLGSATYASGLTIQAPLATSVDLSKATGVTGTLNITAAATADVKLDLLASTTTVNIAGPLTISLPKYPAGLLTSDATTVTLAKHSGATQPALSAVTTLTMGAINTAAFNLANYNATLLTASITALSTSTISGVTSSTNAKLTGLTLAGPMVSAVVDDQTKLASLATSGVINSLTVNSCDIITGLTLAHTHLIGGTGSVLVVTGNPKLTALVSSTDYPAAITVTGNVLLTSLNLSSYVTKLLVAPGASTAITINGNKLSGVYTNAVAITPTTPYIESTITSTALATLKAFVATYPTTAPPALVMNVDLDLVTLGSVVGNATLTARMNGDTASAVFTAASKTGVVGIVNKAEMALVQ